MTKPNKTAKEEIKKIIMDNSSCWNPYCAKDAECQEDRDIVASKIFNWHISQLKKFKEELIGESYELVGECKTAGEHHIKLIEFINKYTNENCLH